MKNLIIITLFSLFFTTRAKADLGHFDVFTLSIDEEIYYLSLEGFSPIIEDLCFYSFNNDNEKTFIANVSEHINMWVLRGGNVTLYKTLDIIDLVNFKKIPEFRGNVYADYFYKLSDEIEMKSEYVLKNYELLNATKGNTYGYGYTDELNEVDNYWLTEYPLEMIYRGYYEICTYELYAIEGNISENEKKTY